MNDGRKLRILVVDDEPIIRETMSLLLATQGYEVTTAEDGFEALLQLKKTPPDLLISDLNMPHMSGFELLSVVRRRFPDIPVIAISGACDSAARVPAGVMADAFYPKGRYELDEIFRTIADLIQSAPNARTVCKMARSPNEENIGQHATRVSRAPHNRALDHEKGK